MYFATLGIPLLSGRHFDGTDTRDSPSVTVISQTMARQYWPNENPLGRQLRLGGAESQEPWLTIAGIAGDVRNPLLGGPQPIVYRLYLQNQNPAGDLIVRTSMDPKSVVTLCTRRFPAADRCSDNTGEDSRDNGCPLE